MIFARLAVFGAIACTLWFNGSYAYAKASGEAHQLAMVAVAITIDLCKCGFLPAASYLWLAGHRGPAAVLFAMWPLTFSYSLFAGYAAITTNRTSVTATTEGIVQARARAQTDYNQATSALAVATSAPLWTTTAACTSLKTNLQRQFCEGITRMRQQQDAASTILSASKPAHVDPELTVLADVTQFSTTKLLLVIAFIPALILELVSSLGYYAVRRRPHAGGSRTPVERPSKVWFAQMRPARTNAPVRVPEGSGEAKVMPDGQASSAARPTWKINPVT